MFLNKIKGFLIFILVIISISSIYSGVSISCDFKPTCLKNEALAFFIHNNLSSNIRTTLFPNTDSNYNLGLCCSSPYDRINFTTISTSQQCQGDNVKEIMYFTNTTNARIAYDNYSFTPYKLCVRTMSQKTDLDIQIIEREEIKKFENSGYTCLYRTSNKINGVMGSCDSSYTNKSGDSQVYRYSVYGRVFENIDSLNCNFDCTSELDNRIYAACSRKIKRCSNVPVACDGSLIGAWVGYNSTHEIKCDFPWNLYRKKVFTDEYLEVDTTNSECKNVIKKVIPIILEGEQINMNIYICMK